MNTQFLEIASNDNPFRLSNGSVLQHADLAYEIYGELNDGKDNAILLFHALSGSQHVAGLNPEPPRENAFWTKDCYSGWWDSFVGPGKALNTDKFAIICVNYLGGCYGSTGPSSIDPTSGTPYGSKFPEISISDIVDSQLRLLDQLAIEQLHAVVGPSLGGMMAINLATRYPERVDRVIPIATALRPSTLHCLHNFEQIQAIESDPNFRGGDYYSGAPPHSGLALARSIAHKTYVSLKTLEDRARSEVVQPTEGFKVYRFNHSIESYMQHHGRKFLKRFDANTYLHICSAWQRFNLLDELGFKSFQEVFKHCNKHHYLVLSIDSDVCFYPEEQAFLVNELKQSGIKTRYATIHSEKGHDAFLLEPDLIEPLLRHALEVEW